MLQILGFDLAIINFFESLAQISIVAGFRYTLFSFNCLEKTSLANSSSQFFQVVCVSTTRNVLPHRIVPFEQIASDIPL